MTEYKILGQSAPSAYIETNLYSVPATKSAVVRAINVTNTSASEDTFDIAIVENGNIATQYNNLFLSLATSQQLNISTNGISWEAVNLPPLGTWSSVAYGNGVFLITPGDRNSTQIRTVLISTNGVNWTMATSPVNAMFVTKFGNGVFVTVSGYNRNVARSTDGITWTVSSLAFPAAGGYNEMVFGGGKFVAVEGTADSTGNAAISSTDAITWTAATLPFSMGAGALSFGNGIYIAIKGGNFAGQDAATSTDAITWTARTMPVSTRWSSATYGNGTFVAVAGYGSLATQIAATSTDGITWTQRTLPVSDRWGSVTFGNNIFITVSQSSQAAATSTDGITWTQRTLAVAGNSTSLMVGYFDANVTLYPITNNKDYLFKSYNILANETVTIKGGYTMGDNDQIRINSTNARSTFHAFGGEI